ncbi:MAG: hypothetical protein IIY72_05040 [Solobacterium sp.]|nr:hypothetical protein [Solobacterium sp.]
MKKYRKIILSLVLLLSVLIVYAVKQQSSRKSAVSVMSQVNASLQEDIPEGVYPSVYEVFVGSFYDADGDGTGDLNGVTQKLDYIHDLGFRGIWLMPIAPSPTYHKYDVADYTDIDPAYGTREDFRTLAAACRERRMQVIVDLVLNHTSVQHPWFQTAAAYLHDLPEGAEPDPQACPYVDYYRFTRQAQGGYAQLADSGWYYEARFWEGMPDLNLDSDAVRREIREIMRYWLNEGADGFRLDAVTSYYTGNADKNIEFLSFVNQTAKELDPDCYIVCEGWDSQKVYARYYASGVDSMFDFAFADASGIIAGTLLGQYTARDFGNMLEKEWQLYESYGPQAVNAPFYTNHDMGRSAGYYATDEGDRTKLAQAMNLLAGGKVFLYYGEEIGMKGAGRDENKRAPMYWSDDPQAAGMTQAPPGMDNVQMKFPSLAEQEKDPYSILNYIREVMRIRNALPVITSGRTWVHQDLTTDDVCVLIREDGVHAPALVVYNISPETQTIHTGSTEFHHLKGVLTVSAEPVGFRDDTLTLPPWGTAVLTGEE